jgi:hypothetical protein
MYIVNGRASCNTRTKVLSSGKSTLNSSDNDIEKPILNKNANLMQNPLNKNIKHTILLIGDSHI